VTKLMTRFELEKAICEMLGLDISTVTALEIRLNIRDVPQIVVERFMTNEEGRVLVNAAQDDFRCERLRFKLEEQEEIGDKG
jgi:hypothetical protein